MLISDQHHLRVLGRELIHALAASAPRLEVLGVGGSVFEERSTRRTQRTRTGSDGGSGPGPGSDSSGGGGGSDEFEYDPSGVFGSRPGDSVIAPTAAVRAEELAGAFVAYLG